MSIIFVRVLQIVCVSSGKSTEKRTINYDQLLIVSWYYYKIFIIYRSFGIEIFLIETLVSFDNFEILTYFLFEKK